MTTTDVSPDAGPATGRRRSRLLKIGGAAAVVLVAAGVALWWFVFRDDAPPPVDLDRAVAQLPAELGTERLPGFDDDIEGGWTLDTTIGTFDYATASGSFAGFRVDEELTLGETTAVGRTGDVSGSLEILDGTLVGTEVTVDMTTITTDRSQRDGRVQGALDTDEFPTATFTLTTPVALPEAAAANEAFSVVADGDLTIHGVTRPASFALDAVLDPRGIVVVTGSTDIVFEDFGVTPPSAPVVLSVDDEGVIEFQLLFTK